MKTKTNYVCNNCSYKASRWQGQCPQCKEWNTFEEVLVSKTAKSKKQGTLSNIKPQRISDIELSNNYKVSTNIKELDRALSGGIVKGQVILIAGHPGIGKSTLLLQMSSKITDGGHKTLYVSAEESVDQVAARARRLEVKEADSQILSITDIDSVLEIASQYDFVVIDSIQMMTTDDLQNRSGSVPQIVECTNRIVEMAKRGGVTFVIVGHITKDGTIAGPKMLEHMVDTVLYLEGDKQSEIRLLRVQKNRYGSDSEVGIFSMTTKGLQCVSDMSSIFEVDTNSMYGTALTVILEGSRPVVVEVQALTVKSSYGYPKRTATGISLNRLQMLIAVIQKYAGLKLDEYDVFVNITAGINVRDPSVDLAVVAAIISSYYEKPYTDNPIFIGEVGLTSEVRHVSAEDRRIKEAKILGYKHIYTYDNVKKISILKQNLL